MKGLIIQLNQRMSMESKGNKYVEAVFAAKYFKQFYGYDVVDIAEKKIRNANDSYLDITETNFNDYDDVIIIGSPINLFGGIVGDELLLKIRKIIDFNGSIFYLLTDPEIYYRNIAEVIYKKNPEKYITKEELEKFNAKMLKCKVFFTGYDYKAYCKLMEKKYTDVLDLYDTIKLFEYQFKMIELPEFDNVKEYDLIYYGSNRTGDRQSQLKKYFDENKLNKLLIGMDKMNFESTKQIGKVNHQELLKHINKVKYNLCISDKGHSGNWITYRFLEGIVCNTVNLIDIKYDDKTLYQNQLLKDVCYVTCIEDVYQAISYIETFDLYDEIIRLQHIEFKRITE